MHPHSRKVSLRERAVTTSGALTLAYSAWGLGGHPTWSMHILLAGGLLTLLLALQPWGGRDEKRSPAMRLARFPGTYFAALFLLYLVIGALNPNHSVEVIREGTRWSLEKIPAALAEWLPTSVDSTHLKMSAWWIVQYHLAALALALGLYGALTRRSSVHVVLWVLLINLTLMAGVGIAQNTNGTDKLLFFYDSANPLFWGSFQYRNQGAAYLNWGIVVAAVLFFYYANRSWREGRSGGPHFLIFCFIGIIAASVGLALSRGGILFASILVSVFLILAILSYMRNAFRIPITIFAPLTLLFGCLLGFGLFQAHHTIDWDAVEKRFGDVTATIDNAEKDIRYLTSVATWDMAEDELWLGWGAGSFRYVFPQYQAQYPSLFYNRYNHKLGWHGGRKVFYHAHNDVFHFLAEYGIVGTSILLICILTFLTPPLFAHFSLASIFLWVGFLAAIGHNFLDFIFHSPCYWSAFLGSIALVSRLLLLDAREA